MKHSIEVINSTLIVQEFADYRKSKSVKPLFLNGSAEELLQDFPNDSIDCCITSPPYWSKRVYSSGGIGMETDPDEYIASLLNVFAEVSRVLKSTGSFWLNLGDSYFNKQLLGLPWRVAFALMDQQGWILRNSVVWNKVKGGLDNSNDRLRNVHEMFFHFVKKSTGYYYDADAIRNNPKQAKVVNGAVVSASGVRGVRYKRQIELSTSLSETEKCDAFAALESVLDEVRNNKLADFRMIIRGQQRTTHSNSEKVSGRARELQQKGFYFLRFHPNGSKPSDVWDILPEDTQNRNLHFAPFPEDLCKIPILATCPINGIVLDPFCGTGTTNITAFHFGRKSIGVDIALEYIEIAQNRCSGLL